MYYLSHLFAKLPVAILLAGMFVLAPGIGFAQNQVQSKVDADTFNRAVTIDTIAFPRPADTVAARQKALGNAATTSAADTTSAEDTVAAKQGPWQPNPKKAGFYSAILPGLGQTYNRQYWKIPVVYAGVGAAAYFISNNLSKYISYRKAYISRINNPNYVDQYTTIYGAGGHHPAAAVAERLQQIPGPRGAFHRHRLRGADTRCHHLCPSEELRRLAGFIHEATADNIAA